MLSESLMKFAAYMRKITTRKTVKGPFTLEPGRHIAFEGRVIAYVQRTGDSLKGWQLGPADVDDLAHEVVASLNRSYRTRR